MEDVIGCNGAIMLLDWGSPHLATKITVLSTCFLLMQCAKSVHYEMPEDNYFLVMFERNTQSAIYFVVDQFPVCEFLVV